MAAAARSLLVRAPIDAAKHVLRGQIKMMLASIPMQERIIQSQVVTQKVLENERFKSSSRVSVYLSVGHEVDTLDILNNAFAEGKECFIPKYDPKSRNMDMVRLNSMAEYDGLPTTPWGIKQHADGQVLEDALATGGLDLVIVPGLAFTKAGHRLGSGRGYYDLFFDRCLHDPHGHPYTIGLAFAEQVFRSIPADTHDVKLDEVLSATACELKQIRALDG
jgi:5-formyltetrahydrofolate cyclo-ligase